MNIAILGYGTVGSGVAKIIENAKTPFTKNIHISHILIRKGKAKTLPCMCEDYSTILEDKNLDIVVETMGGIEPAHTYILEALRHGLHVVSANKAVLSQYLREFSEVAKSNHVKIYYEASTGGGIPWIEGLAKVMRIDEVDEIYGIFNGTSNYILDQMERFHKAFDEVLKKAQALGYAESDPSSDIDGIDIQNKLIISASLAYDYHMQKDFPILGIRNITKEDVSYFMELGYHIRLLAKTKRKQHFYGCVVEPVLFPSLAIESNTLANNNVITLHGESIGYLKFYGQGAGQMPTANAIVQDIIDISENTSHWVMNFENLLQYKDTICKHDYIIRLQSKALGFIDGLNYKVEHFKGNSYYHIKNILVTDMHQRMSKILEVDSMAFMGSIFSKEEDND